MEKKPLLKLSTDFVFKKIFAQDNEVLVDLLNAVLDLPPGETISELEVLNPEIPKDHSNAKISLLDIRATTKKGVQFIVEMQAFPQKSFITRAIFYWAQAFSKQINSGQGYSFLERCYSVNFLDFNTFPANPNYLSHFLLLNTEDPSIQLTDLIDMTFIEIKKFPTQRKPFELKNNLETWIYLFAHCEELTEDDMKTIIDKNPMTKKAFDKLTHISADDKTREEYDAHMRWQLSQKLESYALRKEGREEGLKEGIEKGIEKGVEKGREEGLKEGIEKGREEGLKEGVEKGIKNTQARMVRQLMVRGTDIHLIAEITGLSLEQIEALKENA